jgi:hypothetical protein
MNAKKRDESLASESAGEATAAAGRLQLSVKRMKRLRVAVKGGFETELEQSAADHSW